MQCVDKELFSSFAFIIARLPQCRFLARLDFVTVKDFVQKLDFVEQFLEE
jgi:hypothetical protein